MNLVAHLDRAGEIDAGYHRAGKEVADPSNFLFHCVALLSRIYMRGFIV
jgi:hypothetical protein